MPAFKKIFRQMFSRKQDFPGVVISHPPEEWIDSKARDFALIEELERRAGIREFLRRRGFVKREYRVKLLGLYPDLDWHGDFGKWKLSFHIDEAITRSCRLFARHVNERIPHLPDSLINILSKKRTRDLREINQSGFLVSIDQFSSAASLDLRKYIFNKKHAEIFRQMEFGAAVKLVIIFLYVQGYDSSKNTFREVAKRKTFTATYIREETNTLLEDCALLCMVTNVCHSFFHDKYGGLCRLIAGHLLKSQMVASSSTTLSYYKSDTDIPDYCPVDFDDNYIPTVCFKIFNHPLLNEAARSVCGNYTKGDRVGHLLTINSLQMHTKLEAILDKERYHIDGYEQLPAGIWVDWKGDHIPWIHWENGEPDDSNGQQQCMTLRKQKNGAFLALDVLCNDMPDRYADRFLCQIQFSA